jgi:hypothetical protein
LGGAFHSFRNKNAAPALKHASTTPAEIVEAIGHCRLRLQFVREQQTTNLGVRSSNLFGRAKSSTKIETSLYDKIGHAEWENLQGICMAKSGVC